MTRLGPTAIVLVATVLATPALACSYMPDERPWAERIGEEPVIFVGTVADIEDASAENCKRHSTMGGGKVQPVDLCNPLDTASGLVVFEIETPIRGIGTTTHVAGQGQGADCGIIFETGQRWLFAGTFIGGPSQMLDDMSEDEVDALVDAAFAAVD
jgi:hypothetical protein